MPAASLASSTTFRTARRKRYGCSRPRTAHPVMPDSGRERSRISPTSHAHYAVAACPRARRMHTRSSGLVCMRGGGNSRALPSRIWHHCAHRDIAGVLLNGRKKIPKRRARAIQSVAMTIGRNHLFGHTFKDAAHVFWLLAEVGTYIVAPRVIATDCLARARLLGIFFRPFNST